MRLIGKCPNCGNEDTIRQFWKERGDFKDYHKVKCDACEIIWEDWLSGLVFPEERKGNKLIPVEVKRNKYNEKEYGAGLAWPSKRDIPWSDLIISILNAALITRFNLDVCFATEGGVKGIYKRCYIELRNRDDKLGLYVEDAEYRQGGGLTETLDFYEKMLRYLFEEGFRLYGKEYRRGEILRIPKDGDVNRVWEILSAMLTKTRSKKFASRVVGEIAGVASNPFSRPYLRGLSDEEIAAFFVPPPIKPIEPSED